MGFNIDPLPKELRHGAVSIGNFDGVHRGHARLVQRLVERARAIPGPAVVFTFDPHPSVILRPQAAPPALLTLQRKKELLAALGVDAVFVQAVDQEFLNLTPEQYFHEIIRGAMDARVLVEGPNFRFGHGRRGTIETLDKLCHDAGIELEVVPPVEHKGEVISSTRVRRALTEGDVALAAELLTQPYRISGVVVPGAGRGRPLGFPTANLEGVRTLVPAPGIYAATVPLGGRNWTAAVHIGPVPTFGEADAKIEAYLVGWEGDLYGRTLEVDFRRRIRDIRKFDSAAELTTQLHADVAAAREVCESRGGDL